MCAKYNGIESLESRRLLSAAVVAGTTLLVKGDAGVPNTISVHYTDAGDQVEVTIDSTNKLGVVKHLDKFFPTTLGITQVVVRGGAKADVIDVGQSGKNFDLATNNFAMPGADTIHTGDESDWIDAGAGNDTVHSGDGNDTVRGGQGDDSLHVGDGNDKVAGGQGNDVIVAGDGNDLLTGGSGADSVTAGDGTDLIYGGAGNDTLTAGDGVADSLYGGAGDDTLTAGNGGDTFGAVLGHNTVTGGIGQNTFNVKSLVDNTTNYDPTKDILVIKHGLDSTGPSNVS